MFFFFIIYVSNCVPADQFLFCFVFLSMFLMITLPTTGDIFARSFCLRNKKQKKVPCGGGSVSGGTAFS